MASCMHCSAVYMCIAMRAHTHMHTHVQIMYAYNHDLEVNVNCYAELNISTSIVSIYTIVLVAENLAL